MDCRYIEVNGISVVQGMSVGVWLYWGGLMWFSKFLSKRDQHTYGLLLRVIGTLMWIYITAPIGGFVVILGELVSWINFDEKE